MQNKSKSRTVFMILAIVFSSLFALSLLALLGGNSAESGTAEVNPVSYILVYFFLLGVPAIVFWILFFMKNKNANGTGKKKAAAKIPSRQISVDPVKFETDAVYKEKVSKQIAARADKEYGAKVALQEQTISSLEAKRTQEMNRILSARWKREGRIAVNEEEGLVEINKKVWKYSDIVSAELNETYGSITNTKTKSGVSVGKAALGYAVAGPLGAAIGGSRGKGKSKSEEYETCLHLGVMVNCAGSFDEIVISKKELKVADKGFNSLLMQAKQLEYRLNQLAQTPMPTDVKPVETYDSVLAIEEQIKAEQQKLAEVREQLPDYDLEIEKALAEVSKKG